MEPSTREKILEIIQREAMIPKEKLQLDATLEELGIASLDVVSVLFAVEDELGIEIDPEELQQVTSLDQFVSFIQSRAVSAAA